MEALTQLVLDRDAELREYRLASPTPQSDASAFQEEIARLCREAEDAARELSMEQETVRVLEEKAEDFREEAEAMAAAMAQLKARLEAARIEGETRRAATLGALQGSQDVPSD